MFYGSKKKPVPLAVTLFYLVLVLGKQLIDFLSLKICNIKFTFNISSGLEAWLNW
jgi:hypothetical protein